MPTFEESLRDHLTDLTAEPFASKKYIVYWERYSFLVNTIAQHIDSYPSGDQDICHPYTCNPIPRRELTSFLKGSPAEPARQLFYNKILMQITDVLDYLSREEHKIDDSNLKTIFACLIPLLANEMVKYTENATEKLNGDITLSHIVDECCECRNDFDLLSGIVEKKLGMQISEAEKDSKIKSLNETLYRTLQEANVNLDELFLFAINNNILPVICNINHKIQPDDDTVFILSAYFGKIDVVKRLLETHSTDIDVNATNNQGLTALIYAASQGCADIVELLVANGADSDNALLYILNFLLDPTNTTSWEAGLLLIQNGANINLKNQHGETLLSLAACYGKTDIVNLLLAMQQQGIHLEVDAISDMDETALTFSAYRGHTDIVRLLVTNGANPHKALLFMINYLHPDNNAAAWEAALLLIQNGANVNLKNKNGDTILLQAVYHGKDDIVKKLLEIRKINIDFNATISSGETALLMAANDGHTNIVKLLVTHGANPDDALLVILNHINPDNNNAMLETALLLIQNGAKVNLEDMHGNTILLNAAFYGKADVVKKLLETHSRDINFNTPNKAGITVLTGAAYSGHAYIVELLVTNGANSDDALLYILNRLNSDNNATWEAALLLIQNGAKVNLEDMHGNTILLNAAFYGKADVVKKLLETHSRDINFNATTSEGFTPLVWAAHKGHTNIVKLLVTHGANPDDALLFILNNLNRNSNTGWGAALLLIQNGANANLKYIYDGVPLLGALLAEATLYDKADVVKKSLEICSINIEFNATVRQYIITELMFGAKIHGNQEIITLLTDFLKRPVPPIVSFNGGTSKITNDQSSSSTEDKTPQPTCTSSVGGNCRVARCNPSS